MRLNFPPKKNSKIAAWFIKPNLKRLLNASNSISLSSMSVISLIVVSAFVYKAFSLYRAINEIKQPENLFQDLLQTQTQTSDAHIYTSSFPLKNKNEILYALVKDKFLGLKECLTTLESLEQETPYFKRLLTENFLTRDFYLVYDCLMPLYLKPSRRFF